MVAAIERRKLGVAAASSYFRKKRESEKSIACSDGSSASEFGLAGSRRLSLERAPSSETFMDTSSSSTNMYNTTSCNNNSTSGSGDDSSSASSPLCLDADVQPTTTLNNNDSCATRHTEKRKIGKTNSLKIKTQAHSLSTSFHSSTSDEASSKIKKVSWHTVEFRNYDLILGDNPSTSRGPPLSIGKVVDTIALPLLDYEKLRPPRRSMSDLIVPQATRECWLMEAGYSRCDMRSVEEHLMRIKISRRGNATESVFEKARNALERRNKRRISANHSKKDRP